jgi:hypothetical protein
MDKILSAHNGSLVAKPRTEEGQTTIPEGSRTIANCSKWVAPNV